MMEERKEEKKFMKKFRKKKIEIFKYDKISINNFNVANMSTKIFKRG